MNDIEYKMAMLETKRVIQIVCVMIENVGEIKKFIMDVVGKFLPLFLYAGVSSNKLNQKKIHLV